MIDVTVKSFEDYKLLGEVGALTPKIPKQTERWADLKGAGLGTVYITFQIDGLTKEDELYISLKYNTRMPR
jgi:hypothetical protein